MSISLTGHEYDGRSARPRNTKPSSTTRNISPRPSHMLGCSFYRTRATLRFCRTRTSSISRSCISWATN